MAGFALSNLAGLGSGATRVWAVVPLFSPISVPVAAGVAILRYRLYDIDLVINRAVVGAVVVVFVTVGYVTAVVLLGALVGGRVSEQYWASVIATALVALGFQPLRRWVQRLGDRAVYGRRAAPYQALADLCRRLAQAVSLEQICRGSRRIGRSVGAADASVRLAVAGSDDVVAHWSTPPAPDRPASSKHSQQVWEGGVQLGEITVRMPVGRQISGPDRELLADIATQAGLGMRTAQLAAHLRVQVDQAGAQAEELEASGFGCWPPRHSQRRRLTRAVNAEVLPHLTRLRVELARASDASTIQPLRVALLDSASETTNQALGALRDIARGVFPPLLARKGLAAALRCTPHARAAASP